MLRYGRIDNLNSDMRICCNCDIADLKIPHAVRKYFEIYQNIEDGRNSPGVSIAREIMHSSVQFGHLVTIPID